MNKDEALKMAIEALESFEKVYGDTDLLMPHNFYKSLQACKEALEQPTQEPIFTNGVGEHTICTKTHPAPQPAQEPVGDAHYYYSTIERCLDDLPDEYLKLHRNFLKDVAMTIRNTHTAPSWQGLSDDKINVIWDDVSDVLGFAKAIEAELKEKNAK